MPYTPTTWVNGSAPALSATNLNNIETGISNSINKDGSVAMTDQFVTIAGNQTTASIAPSGDPNTGIFFPTADTIAITEGGAEVLRIDSSSRILVNRQTASSNIDLGGSPSNVKMEINGNNANNSSIAIIRRSADVSPSYFVLGKTRSDGTPGTASVISGDSLGIINFSGSDATDLIEGARIQAFVSGAVSSGIMPTYLSFWTTPSGGTYTERVRIETSGTFNININGSQTAPAITNLTDNNTGIYWASADKLAITEGGRGLTFDEFKMSLSMGAMI
jgi:hypothetical protein